MDPKARNISTEYQPKGSDRNQSDTLDKPEPADAHVAEKTDKVPKKPGTPDVVDEKGRPLSGDGLVEHQ